MPKDHIDPEAVKETANMLIEAAAAKIEWDTPDDVMIEKLTQNLWEFSAAKNAQDNIALNNLLIDENGSLRPWSEFKRLAHEVVGDSIRYLKTEYDTVVTGAQALRFWQEIQRDKAIFPYFQFIAVIDNKTTDLCRSLHNVIVSVDDPMLAIYFPPNHFNCRLWGKRLRYGTPTNNYTPPEIPEAFKNNTGISGQIFTLKNSYLASMPEGAKLAAQRLMLRAQRDECLQYAAGNLIGKKITLQNDLEIEITRKGFKHFLHQKHEAEQSKNSLTYKLLDHLRNAEYIISADDSKGRHQFRYHYYQIEGQKNMFIVIREVIKDGKFQFYTVVDRLKTTLKLHGYHRE